MQMCVFCVMLFYGIYWNLDFKPITFFFSSKIILSVESISFNTFSLILPSYILYIKTILYDKQLFQFSDKKFFINENNLIFYQNKDALKITNQSHITHRSKISSLTDLQKNISVGSDHSVHSFASKPKNSSVQHVWPQPIF